MQTKTAIITIIAAALLLAAPVPVAVGSEYIPESYTRSTNYYDVTGEPYLIATLVGDRELDRGEDAVLEITLQNYGAIYRIKGDQYLNSSDKKNYDDEVLLAAAELDVDIEKSCADHVNVVLYADSSPVDVIADVRNIESIEAGKIGTARFPIHIDDDAPAGTYLLRVETCYDHIRNVQVSGAPDKPDINYWNTTGTQNHTIMIAVAKESDFEVTDVVSGMQVEGTGFLNITYKNTGEETATDAIARISDMLPFTAVSNQKRLGTIVPGESVTAHFRVSTGRSAVPKVYDLSTGIRFKDEDGDVRISDAMQIGVAVAPKVPFSEKLLANKLWIVAAAIALLVVGGWWTLKR
ncbi:MAG: hypothetical protein U9Q37_08820 [Euryarchaeota archaeon]|nr:hypothetical protein [Euryarchaeota archaeon]